MSTGRKTRLASGVRLIEIKGFPFLAEAGKDLILDLFWKCIKAKGNDPRYAIALYLYREHPECTRPYRLACARSTQAGRTIRYMGKAPKHDVVQDLD